MVAVTVVALAGCGRGPEYQYLEAPDGNTFAKVPDHWTIDSEGWVNFIFVDPTQINSAFVPGDDPIAWRASFNADAEGALPQGQIDVQSVDVRQRAGFRLSPLIAPGADVEEVLRRNVVIGELEGWRAQQKRDRDGTVWVTDHLILTDERRSTMYYVGIQCTETCHERYRDEIDEVLTTFRVEL